MKDKLKRAVSVLLVIVLLLTLAPDVRVYAGEAFLNEMRIYNYLVGKMGLNTAAACGLLANVQAESGFNPTLDGDKGTSYGLFQWHADRKTDLINYCNQNGLDYRTIEGQLSFLEYELKMGYPGTYKYIKSVANTAQGAYDAGHYWCIYYEKPSDKEIKADRRGTSAKNTYWPKYKDFGGKTIGSPSGITDPADYKVSYSRLLKSGSSLSGFDVLYMQICLYCMGYKLEADGYYGSETEGAVRQFQKDYGLDVDGICGPDTWKAIEKAVGDNSLLEITAHPQNVEVLSGGQLSFSVKAIGLGLSYQWYYRKAGASSWKKWYGKTAATLSAAADDSWDGMQVRCEVSDSKGGVVNSNAATLTVNIPLSITQHPADVTVGEGESASFTVKANGRNLSYQWYYRKLGATSWTRWSGHVAASVSAVANASWNGMRVMCKVTDGSGNTLNSNAATVTVNIPLSITQQPENVNAESGEKVTFSVRARGNGLSYQWYYKKDGESGWTEWTGHVTATTSATANESWDGMKVMCVVRDSREAFVNSDVAVVSVNIPFEISAHPQDVTAYEGDSVSFSVKASGKGLSYQWYYRKSGASDWTLWPGHVTASTSATAGADWNGMTVMCKVTDAGGDSIISEEAEVKIALRITQQPENVTAEAGDMVTFAVSAGGTGLRYQWYYKKSGASEWKSWAGHVTASTSATANEGWNGMQVRCVVTDGSGASLTSEAAVVTVNIPLAITQHPQSVTAAVGDTVTFSVKASGKELSYQWYYKKSGASEWKLWAGHVTASTSATANEGWDGMQVRCVVTDGSDASVTSEAAVVTVNIPLVITRQPQSVTTGVGESVSFNVKASGKGLRYQWYFKKSGASEWKSWAGHVTASTSATANEGWNGMQVRCVVTDGSGASLTSEAAVVTVNIPLAITQHPQSVTAAVGDTVTFSVKASGKELSYQWYYKKSGASGWTKWAGHTTAATSAIANESWDGMQVMCNVKDGSGLTIGSIAAGITVNIPLAITRQPQNVTASIGESVNFSVKASGNGLSYQWYFKKSGASEWVKWTGHTTASTSAISNESWDGMQVRCAVSDRNRKTVYSDTASVTLNTALAITQQPQNVTAEVGETVKFTVKATGIGLSYQWYFKKSGATVWTKWTGHTTAATFATANESWDGMKVTCIATDSKGESVSSRTVTVTVKSTEVSG